MYRGSTSTGLQDVGWKYGELLSSVLFSQEPGQGEHACPVRVQSRRHLGRNTFYPDGQRSRALPPRCKITRSSYATTCRVAVEDQAMHVVTEYKAVLDGLS